jgi:hypothetical protein
MLAFLFYAMFFCLYFYVIIILAFLFYAMFFFVYIFLSRCLFVLNFSV